MLAESRRRALLDLIGRRGFATLEELVKATGASESTIRRDLESLDQAGAVKRTHGGAVCSGDVRGMPALDDRAVSALVEYGQGSIGRALAAADLDLPPLVDSAKALMRDGDRDNARRSKLAKELAGKAAADRYAAFLAMVPSLIAAEARKETGARRERALEAYEKARQTVAIAPRLSLDPAMTAFQLGGLLASLSLKA